MATLVFGNSAIPEDAADSWIFTAEIQNPQFDTYYYVQLTGISEGSKRLTTIPAYAFQLDFNSDNGTIVDSGTDVSYLHPVAYAALRDTIVANSL